MTGSTSSKAWQSKTEVCRVTSVQSKHFPRSRRRRSRRRRKDTPVGSGVRRGGPERQRRVLRGGWTTSKEIGKNKLFMDKEDRREGSQSRPTAVDPTGRQRPSWLGTSCRVSTSGRTWWTHVRPPSRPPSRCTSRRVWTLVLCIHYNLYYFCWRSISLIFLFLIYRIFVNV